MRKGAILALMCGAQFMVVLDVAIVNVALFEIQRDLDVVQADLQWVVITYGLTLGGFLLLGGRAADLLGRRRVLVAGLTLFTFASLAAELAGSLWWLVGARAVQGFAAALTAPAALSILVSTFVEGAERNKALGVFGAVGGAAGSVGVMLSGALTSGPGWPWIFLLNVPVGIVLVTAVLAYVPASPPAATGRADVAGAVTVTAGLMAIVYAINKSVDEGWSSGPTVGVIAAGVVLLGAFVVIEGKVRSPLLPLEMLRRPTLVVAMAIAALTFGTFFSVIFEASLFMQQALGYSALETGLAYLAMAGTAFVVAGGMAARVVHRWGASTALVVGQLATAGGLLVLARVPADAQYWVDLFPGFVAIGLGIGFSAMAVQVAAFIGVEERVAGLAGGLVETAREVGGALGTAVVATIVLARVADVRATGQADRVTALTEGYQRGSLVAAGFALVAALVAGSYLRRAERRAATPDETREPALVGS